MGHLQLAGLVPIRAREAAFDMAEELGLEERFRQARAVDRSEGRCSARPLRVNRVRHDFLPDTALSGDQDFGVGPGNAFHFSLERDDFCAPSDKLDGLLDSHCRYCAHAVLSSFTDW